MTTITGNKYYFYDNDGTPAIITGDNTALSVDGGSDMLFNLTRMFGEGNEPATVAEFKTLFPNGYYAYDAGSLKSFNGMGIKTVGFNQIQNSSITALGNVTVNNGVVTQATADTASSLAFKFQAYNNLTYVRSVSSTLTNVKAGISFTTFTKTADFNILRMGLNGLTADSLCAVDVSSLLNDNVYCISFNVTNTTQGSVSWKDICINLSWSGYRNGEYEEYRTQTRALPVSTYFPNGMLSTGCGENAIRDELTSLKAIKRCNKFTVDTETMTVQQESAAFEYGGDTWYRYSLVPPDSYYRAASTSGNVQSEYLRCSAFVTKNTSSWSFPTENCIISGTGITAANKMFFVVKGITSLAAFKAILDGAEIVYPLGSLGVSSAVETVISPELNLDYRVSDFGTEEIVSQTEIAVPCNMEVLYGMNAVDSIRNLPKNYISKESFDNFASALSSALGITITSTYDATNAVYTFDVSETQGG